MAVWTYSLALMVVVNMGAAPTCAAAPRVAFSVFASHNASGRDVVKAQLERSGDKPWKLSVASDERGVAHGQAGPVSILTVVAEANRESAREETDVQPQERDETNSQLRALIANLVVSMTTLQKRLDTVPWTTPPQVPVQAVLSAMLLEETSSGHVQKMRHLLALGADVRQRNSRGQTAAHLAAIKGDEEALRLLVGSGAVLDAADKHGKTPLHLAAWNGRAACVEVLATAGASLLVRDEHGRTPLHDAALSGRESVVRTLLAATADLTLRDNDGKIPFDLTLGSREAVLDIVNSTTGSSTTQPPTLPTLSSSPLKLTNEERNALSQKLLQMEEGDVEKVRQWLAQGADVQYRDEMGQTALHRATGYSYDEITLLLIDSGSPIDTADTNGETPLHIAARNGNSMIVKALVAAGSNINAQNTYGSTPLHEVTYNYNDTSTRTLLSAGADPYIKNNKGQTPLDITTTRDSVRKLLLDAATSKSPQRPCTPPTPNLSPSVTKPAPAPTPGTLTDEEAALSRKLLDVARLGHVEELRKLLSSGANVLFRDYEGKTALHLAAWNGHLEALLLLIDTGTPLGVLDEEGNTPLHAAASSYGVYNVAALASAGAHLDVRNKEGRTPLHLAAMRGATEIVRALLQAWADPTVVDYRGNTARHYANSEAVISLLQQHSCHI